MKSFLITIFILCFSGSLFGQSEEWKSLEGESYSILYPSDWELDQSGLMNTKFIVFAPQSANTDKFKENVNLISQDLKGMNVTLDQYVELSVQQIKLMIPKCKILETETVKTDDIEFHKILYTGDQGQFNLTFRQYLFLQNETAFVITFTSEQSQFENYKEIGEKVLESFVLK